MNAPIETQTPVAPKAGDVVTAHELAADWSWIEQGLVAVPLRGRQVQWDRAEYTPGSPLVKRAGWDLSVLVRMSRVQGAPSLKAVTSYVDPATRYRLFRADPSRNRG